MSRTITNLRIALIPVALLLAGCNITITETSDSAVDWVTVQDYEDDTVVRLETVHDYILRYGDRGDNTLRHPLVSAYDDIVIVDPDQRGRLYGTFYSGTADTRYGRVDIFRYEADSDRSMYIDLVKLDGEPMLETGGDRFVSIPRGKFEYTGTNIFGVRTNNEWGSGDSDGRFEMEVDFDVKTGRIVSGFTEGNSGLDASEIWGNFDVDTTEGTFKSNNIKVRNTDSRDRRPYYARIDGSFHGSGARGVTAIYVEDHPNPNFFGALAGAKGVSISIERPAVTPVDNLETVREYDDSDDSVVRLTTDDRFILRYGDRRDNNLGQPLVRSYRDIRETDPEQTGRIYGTFYSGNVDTRLGSATIYRYEDEADPSLYIDLVEFGRDAMLETGGEKFVSIPSGQHEYTGTNVFGVWTNNDWGSGSSDGKFRMEVDFDGGSGRIVSGNSVAVPASRSDVGLDGSEISGTFGVNVAKGTFSSNSIQVRNTSSNIPYMAELNGSFHGERAGGVTAIYAERHDNPNFFGALAGARVGK